LIQGSAADQTKLAIVECYKGGFIPKLQIHDELCFDVETEEDEKNIKKIMEECMQLKVPSVVDVSIGDNWGETS
jgi:DNA polymerase I-like protein with 3'-5' exonuclease and polymerase domains